MIVLGLAGLKFGGKFLKHALGLMLICWRRMLWAAAIAALIGVVGVEVLACVTAAQFPPPVLAQPIAAALALALAYSAALTVLIIELIAGTLNTIRLLMGEAEAGARAAAALAKHEAADARNIVDRLRSSRSNASDRAQAPRREVGVTVAAAAAAVAAPVIRAMRGRKPAEPPQPELAPDNAALSFASTPIAPRPIARPVPASQLPRIAWSYDEPVHAPPNVSDSSPQVNAPTPTPMPEPAPPIRTPAPAVTLAAAAPESVVAKQAEVAPTSSPVPRSTPPEEKREPQPTLSAEDDTPRLKVTTSVTTTQALREPTDTPAAPEEFEPRPTRPLGRATHPLDRTTKPLGRVTRPLAEVNRLREARDSGGLWDRLGQALVGSHSAPRDKSEATEASAPPDEAEPDEESAE